MDEELYGRLQEAIYSGVADSLEDLVRYNDYFDPDAYSWYYDEFGNPAIVPLAIDMVDLYLSREDNIETFNQVIENIPLNDEEKRILFVWCVARNAQYMLDQKAAMWQAEEYKHSQEKVDYYGTKNRAYNRGYDDYMEGHLHSRDHLLEEVIENYNSKQR